MALINSLFLVPILLFIRYLFNSNPYVKAINWSQNQWQTKPKDLSDSDFIKLSELTDEDYQQFNETLNNILIPRVPGSDGHSAVRQYITDVMQSLDWTVDLDEFTDKTPYGTKKFTNIVATLNPKSCKRLVLSCHYDSKLSKSGKFVGATDSAVPCAIILQIAKSLNQFLKSHKLLSSSDTTLQLVFFDGEEAFVNWNSEDSLYGSRHLANTWNRQKFLTTNEENNLCGHLSNMDSEIDRMEVMVLLDLLGAMNPIFYSHFSETNALHLRIVEIERKLNDLKRIDSGYHHFKTQYFRNSKSWYGGIEDDHIPFVNKGVPVLHIIPTPFPEVWHKDSDNRKNIHNPTVNNLLIIFKLFVAQYLHLDLEN